MEGFYDRGLFDYTHLNSYSTIRVRGSVCEKANAS